MESISLRNTSSEGGAGGGLDIFKTCRKDGAVLPHGSGRRKGASSPCGFSAPVNRRRPLTKSPAGTSFVQLRGHLSRPACSHVKQFAKQAGDRSDPGRTYVQAGFFCGLIPWGFLNLPRGSVSKMVSVQSI